MSAAKNRQKVDLREACEMFTLAASGKVSLRQILGMDQVVFSRLVDQAVAQMDAGNYAEAEQQLRKLRLMEPHSAMLPFLQGGCLFELEYLKAAVDCYSDALALAKPQKSGRFNRSIRFCRGQAWLKLKNRRRAYKDFCSAAKSKDKTLAAKAETYLQKLQSAGIVQ